MVLNACRRQREKRAADSPSMRPVLVVCAQRLSASERKRADRLEFSSVRVACSTPVGVREKNAQRSLHIDEGRDVVLNACRRQREKRPLRLTGFVLLITCAQRLSASE